ncbi:type IVB secretion system protein IcmH/DotU [Caldimonas sp.]|uniref:type IVB secretion system protein IcmH/DotU n=1 Tax=Caldimonas sp. TaxID=2838790 RepID=UPI00307FBD75
MSTSPPSLFEDTELMPPAEAPSGAPVQTGKLVDLLYEGFYLVFLLKNRHSPADATTLREKLKEFLAEFERHSIQLDASAEDVHLAKYAFCALVDETILTSGLKIREDWERQPLQLQFFGDQLAGENFFVHLERLRQQGSARLAALEVFHLCLLLGFQGKYLLEGQEKLSYLTARLTDEITHMKGRKASFAPHWAPPDRVQHVLHTVIPPWMLAAGFVCLGLLAFMGIRTLLDRATHTDLAAYQQLIQLPPEAAHLTITLP